MIDVSRGERILCYKDGIKGKISALSIYRRVYANYFSIIKNVLTNRYPIEAILKNSNTRIALRNYMEMNQITAFVKRVTTEDLKGVEYDITEDTVSISYLPYSIDKTAKVKLYHGITNGDVFAVFIDNVYKNIPVKDKIVVDIGANIGDSCLYFILRGATKVIGLEPFKKSYEIAKKNIELNNVSSKVILLLAGCSANKGCINMDPNCEGNIASYIVDVKDGEPVQLLRIEDILSQYCASSVEPVLKIDCEGCEYDSILSTSKDILRQFSHIHIEYHWGYRNLREKLEKCGFTVSVARPRLIISAPRRKKMYVGDIDAQRK
jgi:FkbM family methyltransferase